MDGIKDDYASYREVLGEKTLRRAFKRYGEIYEVYSRFIEEYKKEHSDKLYLNERVLMHAILDYFCDITRLKKFHDKIERINEDKIIAYESSWLLRRKPIQILNAEDEDFVYVNEKIVLSIFINHLVGDKINDFDENHRLEVLCNKLLYYFKFRNCDAKVLEMFILFFKTGNSLGKI